MVLKGKILLQEIDIKMHTDAANRRTRLHIPIDRTLGAG